MAKWLYKKIAPILVEQKAGCVILEENGKLHPPEIKRTANPDKRIVRTFDAIEKSPLERGTGTVLCLAPALSYRDYNEITKLSPKNIRQLAEALDISIAFRLQ